MPKTIRVYVGTARSLAEYYDVPISLRYVCLPPAQIHKKHPWTLAEMGEFTAAMNRPMYRSIAASILQSGLSLSDLLALRYGDIKEELEKGATPLCLDLASKKTGVQFIAFLGGWTVKPLKEHLSSRKLEDASPIYNVTARTVARLFPQDRPEIRRCV